MESFFTDELLRKSIQKDCFRNIPDLQKLARKFLKQKADLKDVVKLYQFVQMLPKLLEVLNDSGNHVLKQLYCQPLKQLVVDFKNFEDLVEKSIDLESIKEHDVRINPRMNEDLMDLDKVMKKQLQVMKDETYELESKLKPKVKKMELENKKGYGYCLRVSKNVRFQRVFLFFLYIQTFYKKGGKGCKEDSKGNRLDHCGFTKDWLVLQNLKTQEKCGKIRESF